MMPFENDEEFEIFYDFARAYKNLKLDYKTVAQAEDGHDMEEERKVFKENSPSKKNPDEEEISSDDWEDCDIEDGYDDIKEEADEEEDNKTESFEILNESEANSKTESFTIIDPSSKQSSKNTIS